jgi:hypothetical protein
MSCPILTLFKKGTTMSKLRGLKFSALLVLAGVGGSAARAEEKVLVPGDPPLTQGMVDDYCRYVTWRWPQAFARAGGSGSDSWPSTTGITATRPDSATFSRT